MGLHFGNQKLQDATLDVEKPEILVYEKMADGSVRLNGVEYVVPIAGWTSDQPPVLMGQPLQARQRPRHLLSARLDLEAEPDRRVRRLEPRREVPLTRHVRVSRFARSAGRASRRAATFPSLPSMTRNPAASSSASSSGPVQVLEEAGQAVAGRLSFAALALLHRDEQPSARRERPAGVFERLRRVRAREVEKRRAGPDARKRAGAEGQPPRIRLQPRARVLGRRLRAACPSRSRR